MKTVGKIIKYTLISALALFCAAILVRIFLLTDQHTLSSLTVTEAARAAYRAGETEVKTRDVFDELSKEGYFGAYALTLYGGEVQVTLRFNNSTYAYAKLDEGTAFDYYFYDTVNERYIPAETVTESEKWMYHYRRVTFPLPDGAEDGDWYVYITVSGEEPDAFDNLPIFYAKRGWKTRALTRAEKAALGAR